MRGTSISVDVPSDAGAWFQHGWQSWSDTRWVDRRRPRLLNPVAERWPMVDDPAFATRAVHGGSAVGAVELSGGGVLLVGALGLGGRVELDGATIVGRHDDPDGEWLVVRGEEDAAFASYAARLGERFGRRPPRRPKVWCSWYSFYGNIDEQRLIEVLDDVSGFPFDIFQIDDGWQREIGDWRANDRFGSGMQSLASRVRDVGLEPGLWLAPFLARDDSSLFHQHPEVFARDEGGAPLFAGRNWGGACYAIDVTHPIAREVIVEMIGRAVQDGYRYLKLDFLYAAALPGRRHDDVPREHA
ncbi:MAG TPA: glycoside hydrolase family 36 protein, partial [Acidimicrobiales bacterium]|nr:glycoside hydrolase family 36 protein [Acidimicrobiales bacterium]